MINAGTAEADIELIQGMDMTGYIARLSAAAGIHDKLKVKCIIFDNSDIKIVLVVCDLIGLSAEFTKSVSEAIEQHTSIPSENIVISCIHTHSGPASIFLQNCGEIDSTWLEGLKVCIINCVKSAAEKIKPVILKYYTGECDIAQNRVIHETENTAQSTDKQVGVLEIRARDGKTEAMLVNYACHPVSLNADNLLYSKDYPHYMIENLKMKYGTDVNVVFINGCCGDINPVIKGSYDAAEKLGYKLAESVIKADVKWNSETNIEGPVLSITSVVATIPIKAELTNETVCQLEAEVRSELKMAADSGQAVGIKVLEGKLNWLIRMKESLKIGTVNNQISAGMKIVRIGKLILVTLPFEVFHDIGLKIKSYYGIDNTMVIGYANGDYGYLLSKELYPFSEYEAKKSFIYYGQIGPFSDEAEDIIYREILK